METERRRLGSRGTAAPTYRGRRGDRPAGVFHVFYMLIKYPRDYFLNYLFVSCGRTEEFPKISRPIFKLTAGNRDRVGEKTR